MKKSFGMFLALILASSVLSASTEKQPLYVYGKDPQTGEMKYLTDKPVPLYNLGPGRLGPSIEIPTEYQTPKFEFRGSWVATVLNLHMPKVGVGQETKFHEQYDSVLNKFDEMNLNTVIFQVRPELDAYYPSEINPWSQYLLGKDQGTEPGFDPLAYMVEATHDRGMEFHAWLNPYRVNATAIDATWSVVPSRTGLSVDQLKTMTSAEIVTAMKEAGVLDEKNFAAQHPEMTYNFLGKITLDPGYPEVRQHVIDTVVEIISKYDVDAIHFDDYFYPYKVAGKPLFGENGEDRATFEKFGIPAGYEDSADGIEQWRKDNVTMMIEGVHDAIQAYNNEHGTVIQLGISPFGIWEHVDKNPLGSYTPTSSSSTNSAQIFADSRLWVKEEKLDYVLPQLYWAMNTSFAPYGELARWWADVADGTNVSLYAGHANYKYADTTADWWNPEEVPNQLKFNQMYDSIEGSSFYSFYDINAEVEAGLAKPQSVKLESIELIKDMYSGYRPLTPAKRTIDSIAPEAPTELKMDPTTQTITFNASTSKDVVNYFVYAIPRSEFTTIEEATASSKYIVDTLEATEGVITYQPATTFATSDNVYIISTIDRAHNESTAMLVSSVTTTTAAMNYDAGSNAFIISGTGTPGNTIEVLIDGVVTTTTILVDGTYTISIPNTHKAIQATVTEVDSITQHRAESTIVEYKVDATVTQVVTTETHINISGITEANATVEITYAGTVHTTIANADGTFEISIEKVGSTVDFTIHVISAITDIEGEDKTEEAIAINYTTTVENGKFKITGNGPANYIVNISFGNWGVEVNIDENGNFTFETNYTGSEMKATITVKNADGSKTLEAGDIVVPAAPTIRLQSPVNDEKVANIFGQTNAGNKVTYTVNGITKDAIVLANGTFTISIPKTNVVQMVSVTAIEPKYNISTTIGMNIDPLKPDETNGNETPGDNQTPVDPNKNNNGALPNTGIASSLTTGMFVLAAGGLIVLKSKRSKED